MQIKLGDVIRDDKGREGAIVNIGIATDKSDVAGELGVNAKEYDTDLNYMNMLKIQIGWNNARRKINYSDINTSSWGC